MCTTWIVSNRLPVKIDANGLLSITTGGLASALAGLVPKAGNNLTWVGWNGSCVTSVEEQETVRTKISSLRLNSFSFQPVFLTQEQIQNYYDGYANSSLWPTLHYFMSLARFNSDWFISYSEVNHVFCTHLTKVLKPGDVVWVHDYHLMLLPMMLRQNFPTVDIGFFLHVPFPSHELFRCIPERKELIEGLLGANLIGFHVFSYVRHFKSSVLRILGLECDFDTLRIDGRLVRIRDHPIGINWKSFKAAVKSDEYTKSIEEYASDFHGRKVVLSISRLDYTKGIPAMLDGIEYFLKNMPQKNVTFLVIAVPSRDTLQSYSALKDQIVKTIGELNGKYSTISGYPPIQYINYGVNTNKLAALYSIADVALVVPLIDGMNLVAKEFIAMQPTPEEKYHTLQKPGCLVLSEFTGASRELYNALIVNPHSSAAVAQAIEQGLNMQPSEKMKLNLQMRSRAITQDADMWANKFLMELSEQSKVIVGNEYTSLQTISEIAALFNSSLEEKKALFLDFDGTLVPTTNQPDHTVPTKSVLALLHQLCQRKDLDVYVVSGRTSQFLDQHLAEIPKLHLVAEYGYLMKSSGQTWKPFKDSAIFEWKKDLRSHLDMFVSNTPGSFVDEKYSALVWHYRLSEVELGRKRAADLLGQLSEFVTNLPIEIHHGKKMVELTSIEFGKGKVVESVLNDTQYKVVLCIGDDTTDETMFKLPHKNLVTVKVGDGDTHAQHRVPSVSHVLELLQKIAGATTVKDSPTIECLLLANDKI